MTDSPPAPILAPRLRPERIVVLGSGAAAREAAAQIAALPDEGFELVGVVGDSAEFSTVVARLRPDRIVVAFEEHRDRLPVAQILEARLRGIAIEPAPAFQERVSGKLAIERLDPAEVLFAGGLRRSLLGAAVRRFTAVALAAAAGVVLVVPIAVVALAILVDSGRPVLFFQDRVGLHGRRFRLVKFRTMRPAEGRASEWERDNGHRITRVGRVLRRYRLDELPQLWNVLRGDMNLVGPRPHPASNVDLLATVARNLPESGADIPYYAVRTSVRPGITGWAQVRYGYANDLEQEIEKLRYDLYYVKHRSLLLDLRILLETIRVVLNGRGAGEGRLEAPGAEPTPGRAPGFRPLRSVTNPKTELED